MSKTEIPRLRIAYYDEDRPDDVVMVGLWEAQQAEQKYPENSIRSVVYQAFLGAKRAGLVPEGANYESWAHGVAIVEPAEPGESAAPPD